MTKILVIEDEDILREEVIDWLNLEGYEAEGADNGLNGVEAAVRYMPDLIVSDITMPKLDGHGVLLELRSKPATANIPFIFVTARASHEDVRHGMAMGADDYITKPFSRVELFEAIRVRLEKKAVQEQERIKEVEEWQQAFEQEREQRFMKAKLVAMFSHDFRNPLATIMSSSSLLRNYSDRLDEARRQAQFSRIEASIRQLVQMLDDMLLVSQMETGHMDFKPEPLKVGDFIQTIVDEFQAIHGDTHTLHYDNHVPDVIMADPMLLRSIATNFISNAIKYSPQGGEVRITLNISDARCVIRVQDQGIGILPADQNRLFQAFQRGSNVKGLPGTGLGLAIVKQAAELHGGMVQLESQIGEGTVATAMFPLRRSVSH
ncbi:MAG: response regulator [Anaerolineae bacterium]|nr:response regulator [Anaerolineae bacterium]